MCVEHVKGRAEAGLDGSADFLGRGFKCERWEWRDRTPLDWAKTQNTRHWNIDVVFRFVCDSLLEGVSAGAKIPH